ncbi:BRISC complex subunit FAM175B-like [Coccinella septempunctata]|uniref:BRISC complex subunit FAM175B-like n=1 Tax=Coccinella septempunctata TaxID=41139 RepID=UPI001D08B372|nr:BRISC complex subunit FAM175B-like [Coccinella septempunctata]
MIQTISVSLSGPAHSLLLFETAKCQFGQEGFLLGSICEHETHSITDNEQQQVHISRIITVNAALPCPVLGYFYDNIGKIDENKIKSFLGSQACKVIAWYRFSTIPIYKLTLRERSIHIQLANFFKIPQDLFSVCILNKTFIDDNITHLFQQSFLRLKNHRFEPLPLHIMNLQDKKNSYKRYEYISPSFQALVDNVSISPRRVKGIVYITELQKSVQEHLQLLVRDLSEEEEKLFTLEQEVKKLLAEMREKENQFFSEELLDEEMEEDSPSPCEIVPFISRLKKSTLKSIPRKLDFE